MPNGDCPVGAANAANIRTLEREMAETRDEVREVKACLQDMQVRRARLDWLSAILVAAIAGICSVAGPAIAAAVKAHLGQ